MRPLLFNEVLMFKSLATSRPVLLAVRRMFDPVGWECECTSKADPRAEHRHCTITLLWARHGGKDNVERFLKWWLVTGHNMELKSDHRRLRPCEGDQLPSLEELETMPLVEYEAT